MQNVQFPIDFKFNIATFSNDFSVNDANGQSVFYVREKIFTLKDKIKVYGDSNKSNLLYELTSNRLIDFQQTFTITDKNGTVVGKARRKTLKSFWTATFYIYDEHDNHIFTIKERSGMTRMIDGAIGEIPVLGFFTGYMFNPKYVLLDQNGSELMELSKEPSFFGRKFKLNNYKAQPEQFELFILSYMMLLISDRNRG